MKTLSNYQATAKTTVLTGTAGRSQTQVPIPDSSTPLGIPNNPDHSLRFPKPFGLLTDAAASAIVQGDIPDFSQACIDLYTALTGAGAAASALQFIPILKTLASPDPAALKRFIDGPQQSYLMVQNDLLKVILIRWKPGEYSKIHGHPQGGGIFKVLHGQLEEKRYAPGTNSDPLAVSSFKKGSMAYIDDDMAYHAVGNPFDSTAISFHAYTTGGHAVSG